MRFGYVLLAAYSTVLVAELIGDKLLYTVASLSARFRAALVMAGMALAFGGKMLVAVLVGSALTRIPALWTALLSAAVFFGAAGVIWFRRRPALEAEPSAGWSRAAAVSFGSLFLTEWGDPGQIAAAAIAAQSQVPLAVWVGGVLALLTKGTVAMVVGVKVRDYLPERALRTLAAATCGIMGVIALGEAILE
ncbi:MAG: TMEM165/GDT1 family protein [Candidatus Rokubacteria bacterium]|nr:TMEM165/GDT1 family protein [Candidatus Rokubacteria bacterium]